MLLMVLDRVWLRHLIWSEIMLCLVWVQPPELVDPSPSIMCHVVLRFWVHLPHGVINDRLSKHHLTLPILILLLILPLVTLPMYHLIPHLLYRLKLLQILWITNGPLLKIHSLEHIREHIINRLHGSVELIVPPLQKGQRALHFLLPHQQLQTNILPLGFIMKQMEKEEVKLVKSENGGEEYHILINKVVGKGGFGIVNEARAVENPKERLVVKTIGIGDESRRKVIESELSIMSELPYHQNLVKVIPVKMYSAKNYYIFMEYCEGGTLYDEYVRKKNHIFEEEELMDIFYQCMNGYKVLFDKKIMHQDIKPENILIRKNTYKLADFGLSLFYEGHDFGDTREGTLSYIAPEKLCLKYVGNPKADIYSFGVMFYQLITGYHPYVKNTGARGNRREFMRELRENKLRYPNNLSSRYSLKFQTFFDMIVRMVKRSETDRMSFQEIWDYIRVSDLFEKNRERQKEISKKYIIQQYDFVISDVTDVLTLPITTSKEEEEEIRKRFEEKIKEENPKVVEMGKKGAEFFVKRRLIVYYLDRLARKLIVEQLKEESNSEVYDRAIFYLMIFTKSFLNDLVTELKTPKELDSQCFFAFKRTNTMALDITNLLRKDHEYVEDSLCELLAESKSISKQQLKVMFQMLKHNSQQQLIANLIQSLNQVLKMKTGLIQVNNRSTLLTLANVFTIIQILQDVPSAILQAEEFQVIDRKAMTCTLGELISEIQSKCADKNLICSFDMTGLYDNTEEEMIFEPID